MNNDKNVEDMSYEEKKDVILSFIQEPSNEECNRSYNFFQKKILSFGEFLDGKRVFRVIDYDDDEEQMTFGIGIKKWSQCVSFSENFWKKHIGTSSSYFTLLNLSTFWVLIFIMILIKPRFYL